MLGGGTHFAKFLRHAPKIRLLRNTQHVYSERNFAALDTNGCEADKMTETYEATYLASGFNHCGNKCHKRALKVTNKWDGPQCYGR